MDSFASSDSPSKVLVIDDDLGTRNALRNLLRNHCQVFCSESVDQGLELQRNNQTDVIIMDIVMPGKSGIDGLREIRTTDTATSVVMLTGHGALETAQEAMRLGASDYLHKPFRASEIVSAIKRNAQRTQSERRRLQAVTELQAINAALINERIHKEDHTGAAGRRSAGIAHDLRNPLTAALGYAQLLSEDLHKSRQVLGDQWATMITFVRGIESSLGKCKELTDLLLKQGNNSNSSPLQVVRLVELVWEIVKSLEPRAATRGVKLAMVVDEPDIEIMGNRLQLFRAISNVVVNSLEAVPDQTGCVSIRCQRDGRSARIAVQDNGCGVTPEQLALVFEPYYTTKKGTGGTGLGLFVAKTAVEDLHGTIDMQGSAGKGTLVSIRLPLHEAAP